MMSHAQWTMFACRVDHQRNSQLFSLRCVQSKYYPDILTEIPINCDNDQRTQSYDKICIGELGHVVFASGTVADVYVNSMNHVASSHQPQKPSRSQPLALQDPWNPFVAIRRLLRPPPLASASAILAVCVAAFCQSFKNRIAWHSWQMPLWAQMGCDEIRCSIITCFWWTRIDLMKFDLL